jgi:hypothetical protein
MDPVWVLVLAYRVAGSLAVLRWPFWGALLAILCDLFDLLILDLLARYGGWQGFAGYQQFDKWADQVYLAAFLVVAIRDFTPLTRRVAIVLYLVRLVGFIGFEAGLLPREALIVFPNLFEFWFLAVVTAAHFRPTFVWTLPRTVATLAVLGVAKLAQEWALHVGKLFDGTTFLGALEAIWAALTGVGQ